MLNDVKLVVLKSARRDARAAAASMTAALAALARGAPGQADAHQARLYLDSAKGLLERFIADEN